MPALVMKETTGILSSHYDPAYCMPLQNADA